ncbi:metallophosphoesterase [Polyangium jinanense]|uniref:Metallophosphoesterase n=1 Tax=Polyangium jinanense TaxID=2829994 RepID=A0A9X4AXB1_9BACT|nr:metallophosphoesterase [Polyangium jinanense]MDC3959257.1 metallophosphoesterase [Polyangium jinanense]MDC3987651.1 metallophosphoesterase [Polyangium jinanense]
MGPKAGPGASAPTATATTPQPEPVQRIPAPARIVAIGDLHGDLAATRVALRMAGAIDEKDRWIGKDLMVVQTGDEIDRGDEDRDIVDLFERLADEAKLTGGAVIALNGNHEVMNVQVDLRYVTDDAFKDFVGISGVTTTDPRLERVPAPGKARAAAFLPGGPYAKKLAKRNLVAVVGDTVFVHGGISPKHVRYGIDRMNREASAWMDGSAKDLPAIITAEDGPVWLRRYSATTGPDDCRVLKETLAMIPAKRMVVGHTVQRGGITSACDEQVFRIDVGMSKFYGGKPEVLEIKGAEVRPLRADG